MGAVPTVRIRQANGAPLQERGRYVLYWMTAFRRRSSNFSLQRAVEWARRLERPLVVLEALRSDYPWASDRLHRFILDGMAANETAFAAAPVLYYPYVEQARGEGKGLLAALAADACVVVTDDAPVFFLPHMLATAAQRLPVCLEAVDSNGLLPLRATPRVFSTALSFRTHLRRALREHLEERPLANPLARVRLPRLARLLPVLERRWPRAPRKLLGGGVEELAALPIDHGVAPVETRGGSRAARRALDAFVRDRLEGYLERRSDPAVDGTSRLSMYLHFGHLSTHEIVSALEKHVGRNVAVQPRGKRGALFGLSPSAEAYLDELVTWRELAYHWDAKHPAPFSYESLPAWARSTLEKHRGDARPHLQPRKALEQGTTHDALFNAAQRQLVREGWFHNQARMVWGKKLLEYTGSPEVALETMVHLMSRYSLDGRDPASNAGFFWVLGRFDRVWGPERPIFGTVRYMSSTTPDKLRHYRAYIAKYAQAPLAPEGRGTG